MDLYHKILAAVVVVLLLAGAGGAVIYIQSREDKIRLEEKQKADTAVIEAKQKQLDAMTETFNDFKKEQDAKLTAMQLQFKQATPEQIATITAQLMNLKTPSTIFMPTATPADPHPQAQISLPVANLQQYESECEECKIKLATTQEQIKVAAAAAVLDQDKIKTVTKERDDYKSLSNGGTTLQRMKKAAKWLIIGITVGAIAAKAAH